MPLVPFGEYRPDAAPMENGATGMAENCLPGPTGTYLPFRDATFFMAGPADRVRGAYTVHSQDRTTYLYAGTSQFLWQLSGRGWVQRGGPYAMTGTERWGFAQFRNEVIAVSAENPVLWSTLNGVFVPMITSTRQPRARCVAVVNRDWVVLGNTSDAVDGERPRRVWWLERANPRNADPNVTVQSGFEDIDAEDGQIVALVGMEYCVVVAQKAIWRMTYDGGDVGYRFDKMVRGKGAICGGSVVSFGRQVWYWDEDGPYVFDGTQTQPIGSGKIAQTAVSRLNQAAREWMSAAVIPKQTIVLWAIPTAGDMLDTIYAYNWTTGRWTVIHRTMEMLTSSYSQPMYIDDAAVHDLTIDTEPYASWPIDAAQWQGGVPGLAGWDENHNFHFFSGPPMEATIETGEITPFGERRASLAHVRPIVDGATEVYVRVLTRDSLGAPPVASVERHLNLIGGANVWAQGRYLRGRVRLPNGFNHAIGMDLEFRREGKL